jgi:hypothetical protein
MTPLLNDTKKFKSNYYARDVRILEDRLCGEGETKSSTSPVEVAIQNSGK